MSLLSDGIPVTNSSTIGTKNDNVVSMSDSELSNVNLKGNEKNTEGSDTLLLSDNESADDKEAETPVLVPVEQVSNQSKQCDYKETTKVNRDEENCQPTPPFHVLMLNDDDDNITTNRKRKLLLLNRRFKCDYLSLRNRAFEDATTKNEAIQVDDSNGNNVELYEQSGDWWSGATAVERALASCCTLHPGDYDLLGSLSSESSNSPISAAKLTNSRKRQYAPANEIDNNALVAGALSVDKVGKFVSILALHCHTVTSRALALAILEQTQEADEIDLMDHQSYITSRPEQQNANVNVEKDIESVKNNKKASKSESIAHPTPSNKDEHRISHKKPERLSMFLNAGGLKILSQWLVESIRTTTEQSTNEKLLKSAKKKSTESGVVIKPAPTGPILLPLLHLLSKFPFDLKAITESKINKEIKKLFKQIDARVDDEKNAFLEGDNDDAIIKDLKDTIILKPFTDPIAGGSDVLEVQSKLRGIMESWETQAKETNSIEKQKKSARDDSGIRNPFREILDAIQSRFDEVKSFEVNGGNLSTAPRWLADLSKHRQKLGSPISSKQLKGPMASSFHSTIDALVRQEREKELTAMMKHDLEKTQEERKKLLQRLKERHQSHSNDTNETMVDPKRNGMRANIYPQKVTIQSKESIKKSLKVKTNASTFQLEHTFPSSRERRQEQDIATNAVTSSEGTFDDEMEELFG